jgi:hypothetical protein
MDQMSKLFVQGLDHGIRLGGEPSATSRLIDGRNVDDILNGVTGEPGQTNPETTGQPKETPTPMVKPDPLPGAAASPSAPGMTSDEEADQFRAELEHAIKMSEEAYKVENQLYGRSPKPNGEGKRQATEDEDTVPFPEGSPKPKAFKKRLREDFERAASSSAVLQEEPILVLDSQEQAEPEDEEPETQR